MRCEVLKPICVLLLTTALFSTCWAADNDIYKSRFEMGVMNCANDVNLSYRLLRPKQIEKGKTYPLVLFLHGAGERGSDNQGQLKHVVWKFAADEMMAKYPCYVLAPQCPADSKWVNTDWGADSHVMPAQPSKYMQAVMELLDKQTEKLNVDKQRIYVSGLSMGGFGTWDIIQRRPYTFAAAVPLCGGGDVNGVELIRKTPVWAFHNTGDTIVKVKRSRDMVEAIKKTGTAVCYTEYDANSHDCWEAAYNDQEMFKWMFMQVRTGR